MPMRSIWALRRALADGTYDVDTRLDLALNALLRDVLRPPRSRRKRA
jgi:hypothetical protein